MSDTETTEYEPDEIPPLEALAIANKQGEVDADALLLISGADTVEIVTRGDEEIDEETKKVLIGTAVATFTYGTKVITKSLSTRHISPDDALRELARWAQAEFLGTRSSEPRKAASKVASKTKKAA